MSRIKKVLKETNFGNSDRQIYRDMLYMCIIKAEYHAQVDLLLDKLCQEHEYALALEDELARLRAENNYLFSLVNPF